MDGTPICVGCWFSAKKKKKVNIDKLRNILKTHGAILKEIEMGRPIGSQGPFHAIIHKMTDHMIEAMDGNTQAQKNMLEIEKYFDANPHIVVVDPLHSIKMLLNRYETCKLIKHTKLCTNGIIYVPTFTLIESTDKDHILQQMKEENVEFPFVCKKNIAHGSESHKMCIIFNEDGLKDVDPPCIAQTFISHGALLYKIYVIADTFHVVERPSLRNMSKDKLKDHSTIFFNSHDISSGESSRSKLTTLEKEDQIENHPSLDLNLIKRLTSELHTEINMTMYGVDIIVCPETGRHYVIDVNVFPGYDGVPNFLETLVEHVLRKVHVDALLTNGNNNIGEEKKLLHLENEKNVKASKTTVNTNGTQNCNGVSVGTIA